MITLVSIKKAVTFKYISCYGSSSRDDMSIAFRTIFKYISCYGSRLYHSLINSPHFHLNTSHVMVQGLLVLCIGLIMCNLNTSHVMVQGIIYNL